MALGSISPGCGESEVFGGRATTFGHVLQSRTQCEQPDSPFMLPRNARGSSRELGEIPTNQIVARTIPIILEMFTRQVDLRRFE